MNVDVHIGIRTQHATRVVAFDQAQFGQHLHIFWYPPACAALAARRKATSVGRQGDGERASCRHGTFLAASAAAMKSSTNVAP